MKVLSFNVNSIRVRLHQLQAVIDKYSPDLIGIQETKVTDEEFPLEEINALGYHAEFYGQKTHYGVALLSRKAPLDVHKGFPEDHAAAQRRFVAGKFALADGRDIWVINCYFPQGESRHHPEKFPAKQKFYADLKAHLLAHHKSGDPVLVMGDMNVAPLDVDIGIGEPNMKRWLRDGKCCFLPEEREWLTALTDWGMVDVYRKHYPDVDDLFSWFDYRSRGFERDPKRGLRIDLILASNGLVDSSVDSGIDYEIRGMEKPSDHCPIWADFSVEMK